jgi:outer membrane protein assembly factor BamA
MTESSEGARQPWRRARRVTNFSTAAFDPSWQGDDRLVFTVFERFSFQIRTMGDAVDRFERSEDEQVFTYAEEREPWQPQRLEGSSIIGDRAYGGEYSLDVAQSQISTDPVYGTMGGAALAMSDVLGNDVYYFLVYNTAQSQSELLDSFNFLVSRIALGTRANHSYGIFRFAGNRYDLTDPDVFYYERSFGGFFALSYPLSKFRRVEASITISNSEKDNYVNDQPRRALLVTNGLSFVWDNSLWGPTGPMDGNRMKLTLAYTTDVQYSNVAYYTLLADYRKYFRLGTRTALASRAHLWYNEGKETRRFFMGGSWDLRGWPRWSIRGQKLWLTSHELRFPFVDELGIRFPFGGLRFGSFRGALFVDAGSAWDVHYRDTKGSLGAGLRFNLGGFLVLRYDVGKRIERNFRTLQKGLFYQFFFGWDF